FTAFLSGMRNRLAKRGVHVVTVLPGFVATRMTEGLDLPAKLTAEPNEVADAIARAVERKKDVIYVRPIWRLIMLITLFDITSRFVPTMRDLLEMDDPAAFVSKTAGAPLGPVPTE